MTITTRTQWLLAAAKRRKGIKSDYALAKELNISTQRAYGYMKGEYELADDDTILRAAVLAELSPLETLARFAAERATTEQARAAWADIVAALKGKKRMVGRVGIEPTTNWLKASRMPGTVVPITFSPS